MFSAPSLPAASVAEQPRELLREHTHPCHPFSWCRKTPTKKGLQVADPKAQSTLYTRHTASRHIE